MPDMSGSELVRAGADIEVAVGESGDTYLELGKQITEDLRAVGFNPTLRALNPSHYQEVLLKQAEQYQLVLGSLPPMATTNGFLLGLVHSAGPANLAGHQDSTLDRMIEEQASELHPEKRLQQLAKIQRYILDQAYMFSPVTSTTQWAFDWELEGFYPNTALSEYIFWSRAWLK
jgi:ABC-type oligopeptide transport system substrate-binding subunit